MTVAAGGATVVCGAPGRTGIIAPADCCWPPLWVAGGGVGTVGTAGGAGVAGGCWPVLCGLPGVTTRVPCPGVPTNEPCCP